MGRSRYKIYDNNYPYFVTCTVVNWLPIFSNPQIAQIILDSLLFLINNKRIILHGYVLMENHFHGIASGEHLIKEFGLFKSYTARTIVDYCSETSNNWLLSQFKYYKKRYKTDQEHQVWQEDDHPQAMFNEKVLYQKLEYIHYNPVKRGYIEDPAYWRYSSYKDYMDGKGLLPIEIIS
ncbi:transposase [candidate division KSB1 bacterium]|nr:transposase [candidate division KSB1 bacterium]